MTTSQHSDLQQQKALVTGASLMLRHTFPVVLGNPGIAMCARAHSAFGALSIAVAATTRTHSPRRDLQ